MTTAWLRCQLLDQCLPRCPSQGLGCPFLRVGASWKPSAVVPPPTPPPGEVMLVPVPTGPPFIVSPPENITVNISQDALLTCRAEAYPGNLTYTWYWQDENVYFQK